MKTAKRFTPLFLFAVFLISASAFAQWSSIAPGRLISPEDLAKMLQSGRDKPLMLQVGSHMLFFQAHIPGSEYIWAVAKQHRPAPDFNLPLINGGQLRLSSYRGKVVLLDFWATWCVPCREETPHFVDLQQKYDGDGLQIIGVSMDDSTDPVRTFYQQ